MKMRVTARSFVSDEGDGDFLPERLEGELRTIHARTPGGKAFTVYLVDGKEADPATIQVLNSNPDQQRDELGRFERGTPEHIRAVIKQGEELTGKKFNAEAAARLLYMHGYAKMTPAVAAMFMDKPSESVAHTTAVSKEKVQHAILGLAAKTNNFVPLEDLHDALGRPDVKSLHKHLLDMYREGAISVHEIEGRGGLSKRQQETSMPGPGRGGYEKLGFVSVRHKD